jgi:hypothetical protein
VKPAKTRKGAKLIVGDRVISIVLTDEDMIEFGAGRLSLNIGNNVNGIPTLSKNISIPLARVTAPQGSIPNPPVSPSVDFTRVKSDLESASVTTRVETGKKLPPVREKPPVRETASRSDIAITRLRRVGLFRDGDDLDTVLQNVDCKVVNALSFKSRLWKEFAIHNRLPGYTSAADHRNEAVRKDPNHLPSRLETQAFLSNEEVVPSSNAGPCLQQTSAQESVLTNMETKSEATLSSEEVPEVQGEGGEVIQDGTEEMALAREGSSRPSEDNPGPVYKRETQAAPQPGPQRQANEAKGTSYEVTGRFSLVKGRGGRGGRNSGRESCHRS